jgi:hypothetical protein
VIPSRVWGAILRILVPPFIEMPKPALPPLGRKGDSKGHIVSTRPIWIQDLTDYGYRLQRGAVAARVHI